MNTTSTTTETTKVLVAECPCGEFHRAVLVCSWVTIGNRRYDFRAAMPPCGPAVPSATLRPDGAVWLTRRCACGRAVTLASIKTRKTDHECGPKCRTARGHSCECSCNGLYHGADA